MVRTAPSLLLGNDVVVLGSLPVLQDLVASNLLVCPFPERVTTDIGYDLVTTERALQRPEVLAFWQWIVEEAASAAH